MQFFMFVVNCKDRWVFFVFFLFSSSSFFLSFTCFVVANCKKNRDFVSCVTGFLVVVVVNVVDDGMHKILPCC